MTEGGNIAIYDNSWRDLRSSQPPPAPPHHHQQQQHVHHVSPRRGDNEHNYVQVWLDIGELKQWRFYRACIAEFMATLLFLYVSIATVVGNSVSASHLNGCSTSGVGMQGIAWAFGGMIFILVYCIDGISGGHINPAVTLALLLARKVSLPRAICYIIAQCFGAILGVWIVKGYQPDLYFNVGGGANVVAHGYSKVTGLGAEIIGTFVLVYTVLSANDPKRSHDPYISVLAPLAIGFSVYMVHLATIPITGTGINPARSLGAAVIYNHKKIWHEHWIFWVGPFVGAALATLYQKLAIARGGNDP